MHVDLAIKIITDCRRLESFAFKTNLGLRLHDVINTKQQTIAGSIKVVFEVEDIQTKYGVLIGVLN